MTCRHCQPLVDRFDSKVAADDLSAYHRRGPHRTATEILKAVQALGIRNGSVLDVGGGIGIIHHELLDRGFESAVQVDGAPAYVEVARVEAETRGHTARVRFVVGDFVAVSAEAPPADVVTLDRVVCCYPDYAQLLTLAAAKSDRALALSYPRDRWWVRLATAIQNLVYQLKRNRFRLFVHSPPDMTRTIVDAGFALASTTTMFVWQVDLYVRKPGPS